MQTGCLNKKQRGMTATEMVMLLSALAVGATILVTMVPVYLDNRTIAKTLQELQETYEGEDTAELKDNEIKGKLARYFEVNMVPREITSQLEIVREHGSIWVMINYEVRKPLMGNVEVVMVFENEVDIGY